MLARLAATIAPPERAPLYAALEECMALYETLRAPLFARLGIQTDVRAEETVRQVIARQWATRGQGD